VLPCIYKYKHKQATTKLHEKYNATTYTFFKMEKKIMLLLVKELFQIL
jgi:hypothetical protein